MATQKLIAKAQKILHNIVSRNPDAKMKEIVRLAQSHFDFAYPNDNQVRDILKKSGYRWEKTENGYRWLLTGNAYEMPSGECMRCEETKKERNFRKVYVHVYGNIGHNNRLIICNKCISEEHGVTGETIAELVGIYAYMQKEYLGYLDKSMYSRFWEKALGIK